MRKCQVPECERAATHGQDWGEQDLAPVQAYRLGTRLRLTVADIGVVLLLCEEHASTLATTAWEPTLARLREWGWEPLPPRE